VHTCTMALQGLDHTWGGFHSPAGTTCLPPACYCHHTYHTTHRFPAYHALMGPCHCLLPAYLENACCLCYLPACSSCLLPLLPHCLPLRLWEGTCHTWRTLRTGLPGFSCLPAGASTCGTMTSSICLPCWDAHHTNTTIYRLPGMLPATCTLWRRAFYHRYLLHTCHLPAWEYRGLHATCLTSAGTTFLPG